MYRIRYHEQVLGLQTIVCSSRNGIAWRQETDRGIECRKIGLNKLRGYKILELLSKSNYLFARDAHPHITSANELYINLKTMLAKFLRSTKVKQKQTLPNIKLATDESFFAHSYCFNWYFLYLCTCVYLLQRDVLVPGFEKVWYKIRKQIPHGV